MAVITSEKRIAVLTSGLWRLRGVISAATGAKIIDRRWPLRGQQYEFVAGWGHKPTARMARKLAQSKDVPYLAIEDGWLRSVSPGPSERPRSLIMDSIGIYYNAVQPSEFERLVEASARNCDEARLERARRGLDQIRSTRLSKYNDAPSMNEEDLGLRSNGRKRVLVIDQTYGDASVVGGLSSDDTFARMLASAEAENPGADIIVKLHPEVVSGRKRGYLSAVDRKRFTVIDFAVNPWSLLALVDRVYVVTSQFGFDALLAGKSVSCFGAPFYAGWGLTDDRVAIDRRKARPTLLQLFAAAYFDYAVYIDPDTNRQVSFEETVQALVDDRFRSWQQTISEAGETGSASSRPSPQLT